MTMIFTPKQMDSLISEQLDGHTVISNEITDHEDDGRLFRTLSFTDPKGEAHSFSYLWSPWDGNDYTLFASAADEVKVKDAPPSPVIESQPTPPVSTRAAVTHTLAEVKKDPTFRDSVMDLHRRWKHNTPVTTLGEGKRLAREVAERHGLSDRDMIDVILKPSIAGIRMPKMGEETSSPSTRKSPRHR